MALFFIGPFPFISLTRPPGEPQKLTERELRPGGSGVTMWGVGKFTEPFQCVSVVDVEDAVAGSRLFDQYRLLSGDVPQTMIWAGASMGRVYIHDVTIPDADGIRQVLLGVGGTLGSSNGKLVAIWTLEYLPVVPQSQQ